MVKFTADTQGPIVHWIQVTPDLGDRAGTRGVKQQSQKNVCRTGAGLFLSSQHVHRIVQEPDGVRGTGPPSSDNSSAELSENVCMSLRGRCGSV